MDKLAKMKAERDLYKSDAEKLYTSVVYLLRMIADPETFKSVPSAEHVERAKKVNQYIAKAMEEHRKLVLEKEVEK